MQNESSPRSIQQHLSIQQLGTETLVYDECRHKAFCLNESSSIIWRLANGERSVYEISKAASVELRAQVGEEFVLFALDELRRDGLIERLADVDVVPAVSRRAVLQQLGVAGAMLVPVVSAIFAPTAAQAYSGCFDCDTSSTVGGVQAAKTTRAARPTNRQIGTFGIPAGIPDSGDAAALHAHAGSQVELPSASGCRPGDAGKSLGVCHPMGIGPVIDLFPELLK